MTSADVADAIVSAVRDAVADGAIDVAVPATVSVRRPKDPRYGDYASAAALELAGVAGRPPREVADLLAAAVGADAARYLLVRLPPDAPRTLNLDLAARQVPENPAFDVRYAHAETCRLLRNAAELGIPAAGGDAAVLEGVDVALLSGPREGELLRALGELPSVVTAAATLRAPHRLASYLEELAVAYHRFYDTCRVLPQGDEEPTPLTGARLLLVEATRVVLANGLWMLGIFAPERM